MAGDSPEPLREGLRIAVLAAVTDLAAAANGVPACGCPLDLALVAHPPCVNAFTVQIQRQNLSGSL